MATKRLQILQNIATPLPAVTTADNDKVLMVVDGKWKAQELPAYEGEYEVTPKVNEQTLPTSQKLLKENLVVEKIPYYEVGNNSGGTTVTIG